MDNGRGGRYWDGDGGGSDGGSGRSDGGGAAVGGGRAVPRRWWRWWRVGGRAIRGLSPLLVSSLVGRSLSSLHLFVSLLSDERWRLTQSFSRNRDVARRTPRATCRRVTVTRTKQPIIATKQKTIWSVYPSHFFLGNFLPFSSSPTPSSSSWSGYTRPSAPSIAVAAVLDSIKMVRKLLKKSQSNLPSLSWRCHCRISWFGGQSGWVGGGGGGRGAPAIVSFLFYSYLHLQSEYWKK